MSESMSQRVARLWQQTRDNRDGRPRHARCLPSILDLEAYLWNQHHNIQPIFHTRLELAHPYKYPASPTCFCIPSHRLRSPTSSTRKSPFFNLLLTMKCSFALASLVLVVGVSASPVITRADKITGTPIL